MNFWKNWIDHSLNETIDAAKQLLDITNIVNILKLLPVSEKTLLIQYLLFSLLNCLQEMSICLFNKSLPHIFLPGL